MATLVLRVPTKDTPGYLKRLFAYADLTEAFDVAHKASKLAKAHGAKSDPMVMIGILRRLADFLAPFVEVDDGKSPVEALLNLSENEMWALFQASGGGDGAVPKGNETGSSEPTPASS